MGTPTRAMEHHLPHEITQCYLPSYTGKCAPAQPQPERPVFDLPTPKGWKAESTLVLVTYWDGLPVCGQSPI